MMSDTQNYPTKVGEIRPNQLMFTYGVGALVDLPKFSVLVMGLDDWTTNPQYVQPVVENRLLMAVRHRHPQVERLLSPPVVADGGMPANPFDSESKIGIPVATFPRWMVCPQCRRLAHIKSGLFKLKEYPHSPTKTVYRHENCNRGKQPHAVPARFLAACEAGHLDDFPWVDFVHQQGECQSPLLSLIEYGATGEARDLEVRCENCQATRRLSDAFGKDKREKLPFCRGRRPQLRDFDEKECGHHIRPLVLGASNSWFPAVYSTVAIPVESGKLTKLIEGQWATLQNVTAVNILDFMRQTGGLGTELAEYDNEVIWEGGLS